jgi:hypothetical protein
MFIETQDKRRLVNLGASYYAGIDVYESGRAVIFVALEHRETGREQIIMGEYESEGRAQEVFHELVTTTSGGRAAVYALPKD